MLVKAMMVGEIQANCYIVACDAKDASEATELKEGLIIDPGDDADVILEMVRKLGVKVKYIILTHGHLDHIAAVEKVRQATAAKVLVHRLDADCLIDPSKNLSALFGQPVYGAAADERLEDGQEIIVGTLTLRVLHTPGHTPGGICLSFPHAVFTGDTLFAGSIGRTDFPGGSLPELIDGIKTKLLTLDPTTKVYPGHGLSTTIGAEIEGNPFLQG